MMAFLPASAWHFEISALASHNIGAPAAGSLFPGLFAEFPAYANHCDGPRFVNLERQVPDAIFVHEDGTRIRITEQTRTDNSWKATGAS